VKGPYFAGEQWTAVDMSLAPFVRRFYNLEEFRGFKHEDVGEKWVAYKDKLLGEFLSLWRIQIDVKARGANRGMNRH
jgi:glutathione S-transferase